MSSPMRAALVECCGRPPVVGNVPRPLAGAGDVLLSVTCAPITPLDLLCATGTSYFGEPALPYVPGVQGVGITPAGERVWFPTSAGMAPGDGSMAEFCAVPSSDLVRLPEGCDDVTAAALGLSAVAAWLALTWRARLEPGEKVVVLGAGGTVGQVALRAARLLGAGDVVGVSRAPREGCIPLDPVPTLAARLREVIGAADVVIDPVFGEPAEAALQVLAPGGRLVNLGGSASDSAVLSSAGLRSRAVSVLGYSNNAVSREQRAAALGAIFGHAARGELSVDHYVVGLDDVGAAWEGTRGGRAVVRLTEVPSAVGVP
ncbi:zinc-binding alcohol dehydrogenase family protein [Herbidospora galbida]|uniref:Zinc-binding alcohol dehydrogenase family protein n=1 Tax=Herbidospora galbida TaxID=2575442 RepID=A0A4U3MDM1_9ACTN|nr:zinc-binding alcohol dehydrogenase family protein [Herbidospora galbida]TKK87171.1 zinc-binding alcohol dehydrogenase family protein [Herbidospora galbida]